MLNEKLLEILSHEVDSAVTIVSEGENGPHLVNTWNSYIQVVEENKLLIPAAGFIKTEKNLLKNNKLRLSICNRNVDGYRGQGTGVIVEGTGEIIKSGEYFDFMKEKFDWARAILVVNIDVAKQTF
ncbi:pyridoxamine 5'-phosphate oxidase family protein [Ilyobacter polytropus]|uniref:Pyridoxamine 5'-phosphate oxidase-related FMN-binding protein n=1 Tax=Ilyobacter polytropus (strain ATCC 51220 / DSM 2926 / LMG 16218 / CuHBu1) TaxID=572544 RepID=E3H6J4_ILYPC|nr:pyridoxamine 5'-phosphate oxidase family protein [Ilyobacter polytropus]ADO81879.1 pyridoxamine 5'-phosphate oxidase-related FMN-binding protein [Ilyobacter polytropus DSM 2926]